MHRTVQSASCSEWDVLDVSGRDALLSSWLRGGRKGWGLSIGLQQEQDKVTHKWKVWCTHIYFSFPQTYNQSQTNKRSVYKSITSNKNGFHMYPNSPRMLPEGVNPTLHKMHITCGQFDQQVSNRRSVRGRRSHTEGRASLIHPQNLSKRLSRCLLWLLRVNIKESDWSGWFDFLCVSVMC